MPNTTQHSPSALLIIDVQQSFMHMPFWPQGHLMAFQQALLGLDAGCRAKQVPVVHIFHEGLSGPFHAESGWVKPMNWLPDSPAASFTKHTHNAFTDTGLDLWLRRHAIKKLIISGIRTEQCCETTARIGSDLGYEVDFVSEATLTFPMTHASSGRHFSADEITQRTELVLADRFARITNVATCLDSL